MPYELAGVRYRTKDDIKSAVREVVARVPRGDDLAGADHALVAALYDARYPDDSGRTFYRSLNTKPLTDGRFVSTEGVSAHADESSERWPDGGDFSWHKCVAKVGPASPS